MEPINHYRATPENNPAYGSEPSTLLAPASFDRMFTWERVVRILRMRKRLIFAVAGSFIAVIVAAALLLKNVYQPAARIEIDPLGTGIKTLQEIEYPNGAPDQDYLETQVQILQSDALAIRVIRALHLEKNPDFVSKRELARFGAAEAATTKNTPAKPHANFLQEQFDLADRAPLESISLASFRPRLSVTPIRNSRLIEVSFASHDPQLARLITNSLVTQFIDQNYKDRYTSTMEASEWLSAQLNELRQKVEESAQAVADYERRYGVVESGDKDVPMSQLMGEVNHQLSEAQATRIEEEAYVRMINLGQADALPTLRDDQVYQNLLTRSADVQTQLAQARTIYGDENSNVKRLESQSHEMSVQVEAERARVVNRSFTAFAAAQAREKMLLESSEQIRARMGAANSHLMQNQLLKSTALANAELYNTLQGRLNEAGIYAGLRSSNIHIVDLAPKLESPTGPHRLFIISIGTLASCLFALVLAFVVESFENTIRTPGDIADWVGLPSLAMLPTIKHNYNGFWRLPLGKGSSISGKSVNALSAGNAPLADSEAIRSLRTSLLLARTGAPPRVMLVSSAMMGEGKTTVSINLASALAQRGRTCLLIDADMRRPRISEMFGLGAGAGLSEVLNGKVDVVSATVPAPDVPGLSLLPAGRTESDPADLLGAERMRVLIESVRYKFDFIVIDSPPVIPYSDARLLALVSEVVILVSRYGFTTRRALTIGAQLLGEVRAPVLGVVLNDIDVKSPDYHYHFYGYSRGMTEPVIDSSAGLERGGAAESSSEDAGSGAKATSSDARSNDKSRGAHA